MIGFSYFLVIIEFSAVRGKELLKKAILIDICGYKKAPIA